jgi:hypothetical protein
VRGDALPGRLGRGDITTAAADVTPAGLCHLGHRQEPCPARPQVQSALAGLAPLGLPWPTTVVAGQTAEAPRALPERAKVHQSARTTGLTDVGACQLAARGPRAASVVPQAASGGPLSAQPRPAAARDRVLAPGLIA